MRIGKIGRKILYNFRLVSGCPEWWFLKIQKKTNFHENIKELRNENNLEININYNHGYGVNVK
jgi:hypothetical protein